ncbi:MAG: DUF4405 domain-containing protein [Desulfopila sp.]
MRKITSLTALLSFLVLVLNSVVLYIAPHGRVAYWADWRFWGLTKTEWANQHIIIGILFFLAILLHTYYNWKPIVAYLKNKARQLRIFNRHCTIALLLVAICTLGAYVEVQPFRSVLTFSESIKNQTAQQYGQPPYGRAELATMKIFTAKMGLDLTDSLKRLREAGIELEDEEQTLLDIARSNNTSPQQVYKLMQPKDDTGGVRTMPEQPEKGFGKLRLDEVCRTYGLDVAVTLNALAKKNINATAETTLKKIGEENDLTPQDVFNAMRESTVKN